MEVNKNLGTDQSTWAMSSQSTHLALFHFVPSALGPIPYNPAPRNFQGSDIQRSLKPPQNLLWEL